MQHATKHMKTCGMYQPIISVTVNSMDGVQSLYTPLLFTDIDFLKSQFTQMHPPYIFSIGTVSSVESSSHKSYLQ